MSDSSPKFDITRIIEQTYAAAWREMEHCEVLSNIRVDRNMAWWQKD